MDDKLKKDFRLTNAIVKQIQANQIETNNLMLQFYTIIKSIQSKIRQKEQQTNEEQSLRDESNRHLHLQSLTKDKTMKIMEKAAKEFEQKTLLCAAQVPIVNNELEGIMYSKTQNTEEQSVKNSFDEEIKKMEERERKRLESLHTKKGSKKKTTTDKDQEKLPTMQYQKTQIIENDETHQDSDNYEKETSMNKIQPVSEQKTLILEEPMPNDNIAFETIEKSTFQELMNESINDSIETPKHSVGSETNEISDEKQKKSNQGKPLKRQQRNNDSTIQPKVKLPKKSNILDENYLKMYPWAKEAAKSRNKTSPISKEVEFVRNKDLQQLLTKEMKEKLAMKVKHTDQTIKKINDFIREDKNKYTCLHCERYKVEYHCSSKFNMIRHVSLHLRAYEYRCTFCDYMNATIRCVYNHYASVHGLPKDWMPVLEQNIQVNYIEVKKTYIIFF